MFKSAKPAGQPRTLRSIAEAGNNPASFPPDNTPPVPAYVPNFDSAATSAGATPRPAIDPQPFIKTGGRT